jgi:hypothetical protein
MQCEPDALRLCLHSCSSFGLHVPSFALSPATTRPDDHRQRSEDTDTAQDQSRRRPAFRVDDQASQQRPNHTTGRPCHVEQTIRLCVSPVLSVVAFRPSAFLVHDCVCHFGHDGCQGERQEQSNQCEKCAKQNFLSQRVVVDKAENDEERTTADEASSGVPSRTLLVRKMSDEGPGERWNDDGQEDQTCASSVPTECVLGKERKHRVKGGEETRLDEDCPKCRKEPS